MRKTLHRAVAVACLTALLSTLAPLPAAAAPTDREAAAASLLFAGWLDWLASLWPATVTAAQETSPDMDPNGTAATPPTLGALDPDAAATQQVAAGGETSPDMDPDG